MYISYQAFFNDAVEIIYYTSTFDFVDSLTTGVFKSSWQCGPRRPVACSIRLARTVKYVELF